MKLEGEFTAVQTCTGLKFNSIRDGTIVELKLLHNLIVSVDLKENKIAPVGLAPDQLQALFLVQIELSASAQN